VRIIKNKRTNYTVSIEAEADFAEVDKYIDENYDSIVKDVKLNGFRTGKIPRNIFIQKFGEEYLHHEALYPVINTSYEQILKDEALKVVSAPYDVDVKEIKKGEPVAFSFNVDVEPEVKLKKYKGIKATKESNEVTDKDIEAELDNMKKNYMSLEESTDEIKDSNIVEHTLVATDSDGKSIDIFTKDDFITKVGTGFISEEFDKNLIGLKKDESKTFEVKVKDDHSEKELAGKSLKFEVKVNKVHNEVFPEINDEFIKKVTGKESLAEYKKERMDQIKDIKEKEVDDKFTNDLMEELVSNNKFDIPPSMVDKEVENMINNFAMDLQQRYKTKMDDYLKMINKTIDDLKVEYKESAEKRVKINLILAKLIEQEKIEITDEELNKELDKNIPEEHKNNDAFKSYYQTIIKDSLLKEKAVELVKVNSKK